MTIQHPYETLTPDAVIDAVESTGLLTDMRQYPLNSYENRVYQVGIEESDPVVVKFYRPDRWSEASILEEHAFVQELAEEDLPVVAPLIMNNQSLFRHGEFMFAVYPRKSGHSPEFADTEQLNYLGRWLSRLHQVGQDYPFQHRPLLDGTSASLYGNQDSLITTCASRVLESGLMDDSFRPAYESLCRDLSDRVSEQFRPEKSDTLRLHGDAHAGNLLWREEQLWLVDFDDCVQGPPMQDIWMLLSGSREEQLIQLRAIRDGYEMFRPFPYHQLKWIEPLRTLRLVKHAAWIAERWSDPAFPQAFPWFTGARFWSDHILSLREQMSALQEEPLFISD